MLKNIIQASAGLWMWVCALLKVDQAEMFILDNDSEYWDVQILVFHLSSEQANIGRWACSYFLCHLGKVF